MPVIPFSSPKGGVGKTTSLLALACQLARSSAVTIIDADPNQPIVAWAALPGKPEAITVIGGGNQDNILDLIEEAADKTPFVLVDLEGTASLTVANAIGVADLVIIPMQASHLDASQAAKALSLVRNQERLARRKIPHKILFTRSNPAIRTKALAHAQGELRATGVAMFETHMHEREAFRAVFSFGGALEQLDSRQVSSPHKAVANARFFAAEVLATLKEGQGG